ncbi:MAG: ATP-dependent helicase [Gemmatimonadota bacterium]
MTLDAYQAAAVASDAQRVVVRAGAGSGKTRVLVARARRAVAEGARRVVLITFTRAAAREMTERLGLDAEHVTAGTVHALAALLLRRHWPDRLPAGVDADFGVAGTVTAGLAEAATPGAGAGTLHRGNLLSYDDLLGLVLDCLLDDVIGVRMPAADLVLVDEAHDLTRAEWEFIRRLGPRRFVVGDMAQAIFGWRGRALREFVIDRDAADVRFDLPVNYRSRPEIVALANRVPAPGRLHVEAGGEHEAPVVEPVGVLSGVGAADVVQAVMAEADCEPEAVAVLARTKRKLREVARALDAAGIPYTAPPLADDVWGEPEGAAVAAAAHVAADPHDSLHLRALLEAAGWSELELATAERGRAEQACSLWSWIQTWGERWRSARAHPKAAAATVESAGGLPADRAVATVLAALLGWGSAVRYRRPLEIVRAWSAGMPAGVDGPADLLRWLANPQREAPDVQNRNVYLSTVHGAKGLEWPHVVIWGCEEGTIPLARAVREGQLDEERRLFYVALTRAAESLTFCVGGGEDRKGRRGPAVAPAPSRFLGEVGLVGEEGP